MVDGDTVFALATGQRPEAAADVSVIGGAAAALAEAVVRAVQQARFLAGAPAAREAL